jgi:hypothetical protein
VIALVVGMGGASAHTEIFADGGPRVYISFKIY